MKNQCASSLPITLLNQASSDSSSSDSSASSCGVPDFIETWSSLIRLVFSRDVDSRRLNTSFTWSSGAKKWRFFLNKGKGAYWRWGEGVREKEEGRQKNCVSYDCRDDDEREVCGEKGGTRGRTPRKTPTRSWHCTPRAFPFASGNKFLVLPCHSPFSLANLTFLLMQAYDTWL